MFISLNVYITTNIDKIPDMLYEILKIFLFYPQNLNESLFK